MPEKPEKQIQRKDDLRDIAINTRLGYALMLSGLDNQEIFYIIATTSQFSYSEDQLNELYTKIYTYFAHNYFYRFEYLDSRIKLLAPYLAFKLKGLEDFFKKEFSNDELMSILSYFINIDLDMRIFTNGSF